MKKLLFILLFMPSFALAQYIPLPATNAVPVSKGTGWSFPVLPACADSGGNHFNYNNTTQTFSCGTSSSNPTFAADSTTNATMYPVWVNANTGQLQPYTSSSAKLSFNPSSGMLTAAGFTGPLTGTASANAPLTTGTAPALKANGSGGFSDSTISGNTSTLATVSGTLTNGHCTAIDAFGNFVDSGSTCGSSSVQLDQVTAATGAATINNANKHITWQWNFNSDQTGFEITEATPSTNSTGNERLLYVHTLSGSTAQPILVSANNQLSFLVDYDGTVYINGGSGFTASQVGKNVSITAGAGGGGTLTLQGGLGGYFNSGNGGPVNIISGSGNAAGESAGDVNITGGNGTTSGSGGNIVLTAGTSPSGTNGSINFVSPQKINGKLSISPAAPTLTGFCTSPSVPNNNGTAAFTINVGTTCAGIQTGSITMPTATTGWVCSFQDVTTPATYVWGQTGGTATTVTVTNYNRTTGVAANFLDNEIVRAMCIAY